MAKSRVRVLRFLAPNIATIEWGEVENGILKVGGKAYSLIYLENGEYKIIEPIILDRGFFGKEPMYVVIDVNVLPLKFEIGEVKTEVSYEEFINYLQKSLEKEKISISAEKLKKIVGDFNKIEIRGNVLNPKRIEFRESKDWLPSFVGNIIEANIVGSFAKELERERRSISLPKIGWRTVMFILLALIVSYFLMVGGYIK